MQREELWGWESRHNMFGKDWDCGFQTLREAKKAAPSRRNGWHTIFFSYKREHSDKMERWYMLGKDGPNPLFVEEVITP